MLFDVVKPKRTGAFLAFFMSGAMLCAPALGEDTPKKPVAKPAQTAPATTNVPERKAPAIGETLAKPETARPAIQPGLAGSFLSSRFARRHQDLQEAARYLADAMKHDPHNRKLQHEALRVNLLAGNMGPAITYARLLSDEAGDDPLIATMLMLDQLKAGDYKKARQWAMTAPEVGLYGVIRPVILEWLAIGAGEVTGEVNMQEAIDKSGFFAPFLTYHMALMNDVLGNDAKAKESYLKASTDPSITPYRVVEALSNFYMRQGQWDAAQKAFATYAKANPDSSLIPPRIKKTNEAIRPMIADAKEGLAELFFTTASILFGEEATQDTFLYLRVALHLRPNLPPAQLMLANLYEQVEDYRSAIATYDAIPKGNVFYHRGQVRKALNYEALGKRKQAVKLLDTLAEENPRDDTALITKGDMLREQEEFEDAASAYTEAIARSEPLKASNWPLLYARGISFERAGEWEKAEADFQRALSLEPNQPDVLNYLAYSWLSMNKNIGKARDYLEIAVSARPEDAHIIDSMGWAEYLAGNFAKAVDYFERAVEIMPDDPTVNDHLGDGYWRVGRQIEARYQWQRALNNKPDKATERALKIKLESGLPPFMKQQSLAAPQQVNTAEAAAPFATQVR